MKYMWGLAGERGGEGREGRREGRRYVFHCETRGMCVRPGVCV